jgi:hypothetical protein
LSSGGNDNGWRAGEIIPGFDRWLRGGGFSTEGVKLSQPRALFQHHGDGWFTGCAGVDIKGQVHFGSQSDETGEDLPLDG